MSGIRNLFFCSFCKYFGKCLHACFYPQSIVQVLPHRTLRSSVPSAAPAFFSFLSLSCHFGFPLCSFIPTSNSCLHPTQISLDNKKIIKLFPWPWEDVLQDSCVPSPLCAWCLQWLLSCLLSWKLFRTHTSSYSVLLSDFCTAGPRTRCVPGHNCNGYNKQNNLPTFFHLAELSFSLSLLHS